ncbi:hypothetical protein Tco_0149050 [Tanacetum coccineum]
MIMTTNTPYPSRKIRRIRACIHQRPQRKEDRYALTDTILEVQVPQPERPQATPRPDSGKVKVIDADESPPKLLIEEQIQAHLDKKEKLEKAIRKARLSKPKLIKVIHEEATKAGVDPKVLTSREGGQEFIKIQDARFKVLNREHYEKIKKSRELRKKIIEQYRWTTSSRLKPETITDIKIHPNTKPVAITVYMALTKETLIQFPVQCQTMVSLLVSKVDRLECAYTVYPILPEIPNQSRIIWEVELFEGWKPLSPLQLAVEEVMSE